MTVNRRMLGFAILVTLVLVLGCKDHKTTAPVPPGGTVAVNSLVFRRMDSSLVEMGTTPSVCCGLYPNVNERAMRVLIYDPASQKQHWQILILVDHAVAGATTTLPTVVVPPSHVPPVQFFASDVGITLSSNAGTSSGTIVVHSFSCTASAIQVDFSINAALGNDLTGGPYVRVQGDFRATFPAQACQ